VFKEVQEECEDEPSLGASAQEVWICCLIAPDHIIVASCNGITVRQMLSAAMCLFSLFCMLLLHLGCLRYR
jgi:hypothetical protein